MVYGIHTVPRGVTIPKKPIWYVGAGWFYYGTWYTMVFSIVVLQYTQTMKHVNSLL